MKFISLQPFVPSGKDFEGSKQLFVDLGFSISFDGGDYVGFNKDECRFILQNFDNRAFAENFMISVRIDNADEFYQMLVDNVLPEKHGIRITKPTMQPYGKEVNLIDKAGVCWHFVE